jgi:tetratricopeptide (TPR) repeat protein
MPQRLRVFISSPGDVPDERLRAFLVVDKLAQDYRRFFALETYRWEHEPMLASGHFQDAIEPPSAFDIVIMILWSRLGTPLPERTNVREYRGIDGRAPITGTEWEYEDALRAAREHGAPAIFAFRNASLALIHPLDSDQQAESLAQLAALNAFWKRHFADRGVFLAAYDHYHTLDDFSRRLEESLRKLIEHRIKTLAASVETQAPIWLGAPFRGLEPYEFEHAAIFFGRDRLVAKAAEQLSAQARGGCAFLMVCGPSGSGKSSLVKAALVPQLMKPQRIQGAVFMRRAIFRPGDAGGDVILGLVEALTRGKGEDGVGLPELLAPGQSAEELAHYLRSAPEAPGYAFGGALGRLTQEGRKHRRLLPHEDAKLILYIDQLEELFTKEGIGAETRTLFVRLLGGLAACNSVWIVATMRADFWHRASEVPQLIALCEGQGRLDVPPASPAELAEMVRKPTQAAGLSFDTHPDSGLSLDAVLAEDAASEPGVLPLLSFTLDALYAADVLQRGERMLTFATYEALGGLEGAIAKRADEVVAAVPPEAQAALPRVLRSLATISAGTEQTAVARAAPIASFPEGKPARMLVDALTSARLLVASSEFAVPTVRMAHEALISRWQTARAQLAADRRDLETRSLVERQQSRWQQVSGRRVRRQLLLRDPDLANAVDLERRWGDELNADTRAFVQASRDRARLRRGAVWGSAIAAVVVASIGYYVTAEQARARNEQLRAQAEQLRAEIAQDLDAKGREYLSLVGELFKELVGVVPEETEQLLTRSAAGFQTGASGNADSARLQQIDALVEMARYFYDAWDPPRTQQFLKAATDRLAQVHSADPSEFVRLSAGLKEITADLSADDDRAYEVAVRDYNEALELLKGRAADRKFQIALARVQRKLAAVKWAQGDDAAATALVAQAKAGLDDKDDSLSERAALIDLVGLDLSRSGKDAEAVTDFREAVDLTRKALGQARQARQPTGRLTVSLAAYLQHLGDALRQVGDAGAGPAYEEAENLAVEFLSTYPNQGNTRFALDLIRHGAELTGRKGLASVSRTQRLSDARAAVDDAFGMGFGRFKFGMSPAQVNALLPRPFALPPTSGLPRAREYRTGDVRYFWVALADLPDFQGLFDADRTCLNPQQDYVTWMFHEEELFRISFRLWGGNARRGCRDRQTLFPDLAQRYRMPLSGTPKQWRVHWETERSSITGTTVAAGPMLDILAR